MKQPKTQTDNLSEENAAVVQKQRNHDKVLAVLYKRVKTGELTAAEMFKLLIQKVDGESMEVLEDQHDSEIDF